MGYENLRVFTGKGFDRLYCSAYSQLYVLLCNKRDKLLKFAYQTIMVRPAIPRISPVQISNAPASAGSQLFPSWGNPLIIKAQYTSHI